VAAEASATTALVFATASLDTLAWLATLSLLWYKFSSVLTGYRICVIFLNPKLINDSFAGNKKLSTPKLIYDFFAGSKKPSLLVPQNYLNFTIDNVHSQNETTFRRRD
jgi:hypothetical protein